MHHQQLQLYETRRIRSFSLLGHLKKKYHLDFAGGLGHFQGKIFRFGHMGYCFPSDILQAVSLMEAGLQDFSYPFEPGAGVKAAQNVFLSQLRK